MTEPLALSKPASLARGVDLVDLRDQAPHGQEFVLEPSHRGLHVIGDGLQSLKVLRRIDGIRVLGAFCELGKHLGVQSLQLLEEIVGLRVQLGHVPLNVNW